MGRIIAIDYGRKRTGIAVTDTLQMIANGLATIPSGEVVKFLSDYVAKEPVDLFVVGEPKQMNNEPSENMRYVEAFVKHLKQLFAPRRKNTPCRGRAKPPRRRPRRQVL